MKLQYNRLHQNPNQPTQITYRHWCQQCDMQSYLPMLLMENSWNNFLTPRSYRSPEVNRILKTQCPFGQDFHSIAKLGKPVSEPESWS